MFANCEFVAVPLLNVETTEKKKPILLILFYWKTFNSISNFFFKTTYEKLFTFPNDTQYLLLLYRMRRRRSDVYWVEIRQIERSIHKFDKTNFKLSIIRYIFLLCVCAPVKSYFIRKHEAKIFECGTDVFIAIVCIILFYFMVHFWRLIPLFHQYLLYLSKLRSLFVSKHLMKWSRWFVFLCFFFCAHKILPKIIWEKVFFLGFKSVTNQFVIL